MFKVETYENTASIGADSGFQLIYFDQATLQRWSKELTSSGG